MRNAGHSTDPSHARVKSGWGALPLLLLALTAVVVFAAAGVLARYTTRRSSVWQQAVSEAFFFSTSITANSDPRMLGYDHNAEFTYQETEIVYAGTLPDAGEKTAEFEVRNYLDALRVTGTNIDYTISLSHRPGEKEGKVTWAQLYKGDKTGDVITYNNTEDQEGKLQRLEAAETGQPMTDYWQLHLDPAAGNYEDGDWLVVTVQSTAPYAQSIRFEYLLYSSAVNDLCRLTEGTPNLELEVMTDAGIPEGNLTLEWPASLEIDRTNPLTYTMSVDAGGAPVFTEQPITKTGDGYNSMTVSRALTAGESVGIWFFKKNPTQTAIGETAPLQLFAQPGGYTLRITEKEGEFVFLHGGS